MQPRNRILIVFALLASVACLIVAPALLPDGYSVMEHTISEAAAQGARGAWLARTAFFLLGLGVFCLSIVRRDWPSSARYLHGAFGVLMTAAAVYSHRPYLEGIAFDEVEDMLHAMAVTASVLAFAAGVLIVGWRRIPRWKVVDVVALLASLAIPVAMVAVSDLDGWLQRVMFLIAYVWYGLEVTASRRRSAFSSLD